VRVDEAALAGQHLDVVSAELAAHHVDLALHDVLDAREHVLARDVVLDAVALPVDAALAHAGQEDDGLAERLGGDGAGVRTHPAERLAAVDDGHPLAQLGSLDRRLLAAGAGSDHEQVIVELHPRVIGGGAWRFTPGRALANWHPPWMSIEMGIIRRPWPSTASPAGVRSRRW
jgi:hypothetical protein